MINISDDKWTETSISPSLKDGEIDVWKVDLECDPRDLDSLFELLSGEEKARADRYVFAKDREHFIAGRGMLRKIIGGYLDKSPDEIRFSVRHYGKPDLSGEAIDLRFNVSHSCGIAVIAVSLKREIGVDIEFVNTNFDVFSVAKSIFSTEEISRMESLPSNLQTATFFAGWTRKEAFLKAMGDGLSSPEELQTAVSFISGEDISYRSVENNKIKDWSLTSFEIQENFKAALVVEGNVGTVRFWKPGQIQPANVF